jgi:hypothetical protein
MWVFRGAKNVPNIEVCPSSFENESPEDGFSSRSKPNIG